ncbi:MAG: hypothetical protein HUJ65_06425 [Oscillospiraceae bacterium]|nr:hypothetical protein [Oscillospiraceae bacterium]
MVGNEKSSIISLFIIVAVVIGVAAALLICTRTQSLELSEFEPGNTNISLFIGSTGEMLRISSADEEQVVLEMLSRAQFRHVLTQKNTYQRYLYLTLSALGGAFMGFHFDLDEGSVWISGSPQSKITNPEELVSYFSQYE